MHSISNAMKLRVRIEVRRSTMSAAEYFVYSMFAFTTIVAQPTEMKKMAGRSYFGRKASPRMQEDMSITIIMPAAPVAASRTKSRNCST